MASSYSGHLTLMILLMALSLMPSPLLSSYSQPIPKIPTPSSSSPATLADPPPSPLQELSPDIAPLFPSPGGVLPTPAAGSDIPTIPSNPSPPNPDDIIAPGPLSASFSPFGSPLSSNAPPPTITLVTTIFAAAALSSSILVFLHCMRVE